MELGDRMMKILIIEDDQELRQELKILLENAGYQSLVVDKFVELDKKIIELQPDLVLLDINLPNNNGEFVLKELRKQSNVPVMMVTSRNSESDEVLSMSYGADDYITKPYNPTILLLHIEALFKRLTPSLDILVYETLKILPDRGIIQTSDQEIYLSKNEMVIFKLLLLNRGKIVSRETIMTYLWSSEEFVDDNTLTVNISRLRAKLKEAGYDEAIETRKGQGYILV